MELKLILLIAFLTLIIVAVAGMILLVLKKYHIGFILMLVGTAPAVIVLISIWNNPIRTLILSLLYIGVIGLIEGTIRRRTSKG